MKHGSESDAVAATNGSIENRLIEPECEITRRNVKAVVIRQTTDYVGELAVAILRRDVPIGLFAAELSDVSFPIADLPDVLFVLEMTKSCVERIGTKKSHTR
jgi:hypothetical protein